MKIYLFAISHELLLNTYLHVLSWTWCCLVKLDTFHVLYLDADNMGEGKQHRYSRINMLV